MNEHRTLMLKKRGVIGVRCIALMDCTNSAQLKQIANKLEPLQSLVAPILEKPEFWVAVVTSLVTFIAVLVALFSEPLKRWWIKSNLKAEKIKYHYQKYQKPASDPSTITNPSSGSTVKTDSSYLSSITVPVTGGCIDPSNISALTPPFSEVCKTDLIVYRLLIKNYPKHRVFGTSRAKDVEVIIESITENNKPRENFLPSPLTWTHGQAYEQNKYLVLRDIHPGQTVYIDICNFIENRKSLILATSVAAALHITDFCKLNKGQTTLKLMAYQDSGQIVPIKLLIEWDGQNAPNITLQK